MPLCPRCGTDQRERPKTRPAPPPEEPAAARPAVAPMESSSEEDVEESESEEFEGEELDADFLSRGAGMGDAPSDDDD